MVFRRRRPLDWLGKVKETLWPSMGWQRTAYYIGHRVGRIPGTPYRIAAGFAAGAAISFTPFVGFHFLGAALLALALRGNLLASAIGTAVGNPWTFPLIWAWIYRCGRWMLDIKGLNFLPVNLSWHTLFNSPWELLWPMFIGSIPNAIFVWLISFLLVNKLVSGYQHNRRRRILRRQRRERPARKET